MATPWERPYSQFDFLVDFGGTKDSARAGFQELSGLGMEVTAADYSAGNERQNALQEITGTHKVPDVTFKRGVTDSLHLYKWLDQVRTGAQGAQRTVIVRTQDEDHSSIVQEWKLTKARHIKYTGLSVNARGTHVAIEELVVACECIELSQDG